jgi:hypothetical protein
LGEATRAKQIDVAEIIPMTQWVKAC